MSFPVAYSKKDLWGDPPVTGAARTPVDMLREQAEALAERTNSMLAGSVEELPSSYAPSNVCIRFGVKAPSLEYRTSIFEVERNAGTPYPCTVRRTLAEDFRKGGGFNVQRPQQADSEDDLVIFVREILRSDEVRKLISGLLETIRGADEKQPIVSAF